jgi:hypothetical protein
MLVLRHCGVALFMPFRVLRLIPLASQALHMELFSMPLNLF